MYKKLAIGLAVAALTLGTLPFETIKPLSTPTAVAQKVTYFSPTSLKTVYLTNNSYLRYKNVDLLQSGNGKKMVFTVIIYNSENKTIDLMDYWFRVKSNNGSTYTIKSAASDNKREVIPAKSQREFTYYADVQESEKLQNLILEVIKWDLNAPNYERRIGSQQIPTNYTNTTPFNRTQMFRYEGLILYTKLLSANILKDRNENVVTMKWVLVNGGKLPLNLNGSKFYVRTQNERLYSVDYEASADVIAPSGNKEFVFSATIPSSVSLTNATLIWTQQNEGKSIEVPVVNHLIQLSKVDYQQSDIIKLGELEMKPVNVTTTSVDETRDRINITYEIMNAGKLSIKLPELEYDFVSEENEIYPLTYSADENSIINPGIKSTLALQSDIPKAKVIKNGSIKIYEIKKVNDRNIRHPLGIQKVTMQSESIVERSYKFGEKVIYKSQSAAYQVEAKQYMRNPWENEDLLQIEVEIVNTENKTIPVPALIGEVRLDGVTTGESVEIVNLTGATSIQADQSHKLIFNVKIPYTQTYENLQLLLKEKAGEAPILIGAFNGTAQDLKEPVLLKPGEKVSTLSRENNSTISINNYKTYSGANTDLIAVDFEIINSSNRTNRPGKRIGYFKNQNGMIFPAVIVQSDTVLNPSGKLNTYAYALIPKNVGFIGFELMLADAIADGKYIQNNESATSYVNPVTYSLGAPTNTTADTFKGINFSPYELSMYRVLTSILDERNIRLTFSYDLINEVTNEEYLKPQSLVFEIVDASGKTYEVEAGLNNSENALQRGRGLWKDFIIQDQNLLINISRFTTYKLNIYEKINNHKRLVASQQLEWFVTSN